MATEQGEVRFQDGEVTRRLVLGINQLCVLEDEFDCTIAEIGAKISPVVTDPTTGEPVMIEVGDQLVPKQRPARMSDIRSIFRAGLVPLDGQDEVTATEAGEVMTRLGPAKAVQLVGEAFAAAFPDAVAKLPGDKAGKARKN